MSKNCNICEHQLTYDDYAYCDICDQYYCLVHWDEVTCSECDKELHEPHAYMRRIKSRCRYVPHYWCGSCWKKYRKYVK